MMTSQSMLETGIVSSFNNELKKCSAFDMFPSQVGKNDFYSIIYNNTSIKNYTLVNYNNFKNNLLCTYISMLKPDYDYITNKSLIIAEYIEIKKEEIIENIENIMNDKKIGVNYEIKGDNFSLIIKPTNSTSFQNQTHIEFDKCEQELRRIYNISNSSIITFFQIEINSEDDNSLYNSLLYNKKLSLKNIWK